MGETAYTEKKAHWLLLLGFTFLENLSFFKVNASKPLCLIRNYRLLFDKNAFKLF